MPNYVSLNAATRLLDTVNRVLVFGCSGGGKSTLSQKISAQYGLNFIGIDRDVRFLPGWVVRDEEEQRHLFKNLVQQDRWIIDGTGPSTFDIRLPRTELVIWVRVPRRVAMAGLAR